MGAIFKRELKSYFLSPIGYIVTGIFLLCFSIFFTITVFNIGTVDLGVAYWYTALYGLIIIVPLLTMRMFAEERKNGTEQLLLTSPTPISGIVFGKLLASLVVIGVTLIISLVYTVIVSFLGTPNYYMILSQIFGFLLISLATLSFGMFTSSITENQIISAVITIGFLVTGLFLPDVSNIFSQFTLIDFYTNFVKGILSIESIISLILFSGVFISLTLIVMQRRKLVK